MEIVWDTDVVDVNTAEIFGTPGGKIAAAAGRKTSSPR